MAYGFVHYLGRDVRRRLLELAAERRTYREVAAAMRVSPAAVSKYMAGRMHPSDEATARLLEALTPEEKREAATLMLGELARALAALAQWAVEEAGLAPEEVAEAAQPALSLLCLPPTSSGGVEYPIPLRPRRATTR